MRTITKIALIVLLAAVAINQVRGSEDFPLPHVLPLSGGFRPGVYDLGALGMILICLWGLVRVKRLGRSSESQSQSGSSWFRSQRIDDDEDIDDRPGDDGDV